MGHCFCADHFQSKKYNLPAIILCVGAGVKGELSLQMSAWEQPQELHFSQNKTKFWSILKCLFDSGAIEIQSCLKLPCKKLFGFFLFHPNISLKAFSMLNSLQRESFSLKNQQFHFVGRISFFHQMQSVCGLWRVFRCGMSCGVRAFIQIRQLWSLASISHQVSTLFRRTSSVLPSSMGYPSSG